MAGRTLAPDAARCPALTEWVAGDWQCSRPRRPDTRYGACLQHDRKYRAGRPVRWIAELIAGTAQTRLEEAAT